MGMSRPQQKWEPRTREDHMLRSYLLRRARRFDAVRFSWLGNGIRASMPTSPSRLTLIG
jgi:hypothetical protein